MGINVTYSCDGCNKTYKSQKDLTETQIIIHLNVGFDSNNQSHTNLYCEDCLARFLKDIPKFEQQGD